MYLLAFYYILFLFALFKSNALLQLKTQPNDRRIEIAFKYCFSYMCEEKISILLGLCKIFHQNYLKNAVFLWYLDSNFHHFVKIITNIDKSLVCGENMNFFCTCKCKMFLAYGYLIRI